MKETVFEVLLYLFENHMESDGSEAHVLPDQQSLIEELQQSGFHQPEISKAFQWLEALSDLPKDSPWSAHPDSVRIFTDAECRKLSFECRGCLLFLEQVGILDWHSRELIIDRMLALEGDDLDLSELKWVMLMVLFNIPGQEQAAVALEQLVLHEESGSLCH